MSKTESEKTTKTKSNKSVVCLPTEFKDNLTIFPDGYGVGTSQIGDIITIDFSTVIDGIQYSIKRFALTIPRAKDLAKNLNDAVERCESKETNKSSPAELPKPAQIKNIQ